MSIRVVMAMVVACSLPVCLAAQQGPTSTPTEATPAPPAEPDTAPTETAPTATPDAVPWRVRPQYAVAVYTGWLTDDNIAPVLQFRATRFDNKLFAVAVSRRQARLGKDIEWGFEGQLAKHFDGEGALRQDHWELNGLSTGTWNRFPWDRTLDTSLSLGGGVSWASEVPAFEVYWKGQSRQLMAYLLFETTVSLPSHPQWGAMLRVHHRSSAYGLFAKDMKGASNAFTFGAKYMFGSTSPRAPRPVP